MSGHNKWSKVKHIKGAADAKKSKIWTKIIREITVAARIGSLDPAGNPRLRKALEDARHHNISKDPIQRALDRAQGQDNTANYEELTYEGYGPAGAAMLVSCLTDNRNRTFSEVRAAFHKNSGNLGTPGSVAFGFQKKGQILLEKSENPTLTEDKILEIALEAGLEDLQEEPEGFSITCPPENLIDLQELLKNKQVAIASSEIAMLPLNPVQLSEDQMQILEKITDSLEDLDDVQKVWTNAA